MIFYVFPKSYLLEIKLRMGFTDAKGKENRILANGKSMTDGKIPCRVQCSKLTLFLSRFLATIWSKKVAKYKISVTKNRTKIGKKEIIFSLVTPMKIQDGYSTFSAEHLRCSSQQVPTNRKK